jgi:hypothetical protein
MAHGGGKRCQKEHCFQLVARGSVYCKPCQRTAQNKDTQHAAPRQPGEAARGLQRAQLDAVADVAWGSCSTVAWEDPGEEVMQEL